jgi:hypothetical protein
VAVDVTVDDISKQRTSLFNARPELPLFVSHLHSFVQVWWMSELCTCFLLFFLPLPRTPVLLAWRTTSMIEVAVYRRQLAQFSNAPGVRTLRAATAVFAHPLRTINASTLDKGQVAEENRTGRRTATATWASAGPRFRQ